MKIFEDVVLKNQDYLNIIVSKDIFYNETYNLARRQEQQGQLLRWSAQGCGPQN